MTLLELSAGIVVVSIIAMGMTSGAQAVLLHYQTDTVRQDLRQYGNNIMREIVRELNLHEKVGVDGANGFARIKLYESYTDMTPQLIISCKSTGVEFNSGVPVNGVLKFPDEGVFRGPNRRSVFVHDFTADYNSSSGFQQGSSTFKNSFLNLELTLGMESDIMDEVNRPIVEYHTYRRNIFLGSAYITKTAYNEMGDDAI